ncbi:MAG: hypothetical protein IT300_05005 [Dehalococcoidia bacterium]|nr:hypothetical protein [Dehalococcoidia bacterium]
MAGERFTVWIQIEGAREGADEWNIDLPDRLATFESEAAARSLVTNLLRAVRSSDADSSEQVVFGVRSPAVCVAELAVRGGVHFCAGCGRCMVGGCDGCLTLHTGDCPRVFCLRCGGQFAGAGEAEPCGCLAPLTDSPFCTDCGALDS